VALTGYLSLIANAKSDVPSELYLRKAQTAAERISAMIQFTKAYEDIGIQAPTWQNAHALVEGCAEEVHLGETAVVNEIPAEVEIFADPLVSKVFLNLIQNAKIHGGNISTICFYLEDREGVRAIVCEDHGAGMPACMKEKLFTKGFGEGHGFGLFLSREILAITGIGITEESEQGKGAKFVITIPNEGFRVKHHR
jgi:signal transduction histidine kinase